METSESLDVSTQIDENEGDCQDNTDSSGKNHSTPCHNRKNSSARRKHAIVHRSPSSPMIEEVDSAKSEPRALDGNENIQQINTLVENTSINDDDTTADAEDSNDTVPTTMPITPTFVIPTCVVSDDDCCEEQRKNSTKSENLSTSPSSLIMLKTPTSPTTQSFRRGGKLRGSAGPVFKSIFQKNSNSSKIQKTLSMDALNSSNFEGSNDNDKRKRSMSKKQRNKELHKSATVIAQCSTVESGYPMVKSLSSCAISREKDNRSVSSTETISSKSFSVKGGDVEGVTGDTVNNNRFVKSKTERKSKIFKTLKSFVGKK